MTDKKKLEEVVIDNVVDNILPDYSTLTAEEAAEQIRQNRKTLKQKSVLPTTTRKGFKRRLVTLRPGEVEKRLEQGYAPVRGSDQLVIDRGIQTASQLGDTCTMVINQTHGNKLPTHGILMEIPEEIYREHDNEREAHNREIEEMYKPRSEEDVKKSADNSDSFYNNFYGNVSITRNNNF